MVCSQRDLDALHIAGYTDRQICRGSQGYGVVRQMEDTETDSSDKPKKDVIIADCGELGPKEQESLLISVRSFRHLSSSGHQGPLDCLFF